MAPWWDLGIRHINRDLLRDIPWEQGDTSLLSPEALEVITAVAPFSKQPLGLQ